MHRQRVPLVAIPVILSLLSACSNSSTTHEESTSGPTFAFDSCSLISTEHAASLIGPIKGSLDVSIERQYALVDHARCFFVAESTTSPGLLVDITPSGPDEPNFVMDSETRQCWQFIPLTIENGRGFLCDATQPGASFTPAYMKLAWNAGHGDFWAAVSFTSRDGAPTMAAASDNFHTIAEDLQTNVTQSAFPPQPQKPSSS